MPKLLAGSACRRSNPFTTAAAANQERPGQAAGIEATRAQYLVQCAASLRERQRRL
jgi:hypothetical protein